MKPASIVLALLAASCGKGSESPADAGEVIDCSTDARVMTYAPGMSVASTNKALTFALLSSNPGPPAKGNDTWIIKVTDTTSQPQPALNLSVLPFMPDHGHGTSVNASITNNHDGTYTVAPLYFFMPGVWRITFASASPADTAVFYFCVPG